MADAQYNFDWHQPPKVAFLYLFLSKMKKIHNIDSL